MSFLAEEFNFGREMEQDNKQVTDTLDEMYRDVATTVNRKPNIVIRENAVPTASDYRYSVGTFWLNQNTAKLYILDSKSSPTTVSWTILN
ncbi:MAG: hypothetical protein ABFQ95_01105 [Pseudomonadota bacterium]